MENAHSDDPGSEAAAAAAPGEDDPRNAFLLAYFRTEDEALHLAVSEDGLAWTALNDNRAVLRADVGNRSIRDPFLRRGADGYFHLLSTDSWNSAGILHARSPDLVDWEPWAVLPVMAGVPGTHCAWAPEFFWDAGRGAYLVFWSSASELDPGYKRIWYAETVDFRRFTPPAVLFDPGHSVIDATLVEHRDAFYLVYKDERGENRHGTDFKAICVAVGATPAGPFTPEACLVTPPLTEGPTVFRAGDRWLLLYDFFLDRRWGASESSDLIHWEPLGDLVVPEGARHGTVFPVAREVWENLRARHARRPVQ